MFTKTMVWSWPYAEGLVPCSVVTDQGLVHACQVLQSGGIALDLLHLGEPDKCSIFSG